MPVKSLVDIASFSVAKSLWSCDENQNQFLTNTENSLPLTVEQRLNKIYPCRLPSSIRWFILHAADIVDKELRRRKKDEADGITHFDQIVWTPFFTIDKVKSFCKTKAFDITAETLCECCFTAYVSNHRSNQRDLKRLRRFFGKYEDNVILYWHWYGREIRDLDGHLTKYTLFYEQGRPIVNVFKFCVLIEYEVGVLYYWTKMRDYERIENHFPVLATLILESDYLDFVGLNGLLLPSHTFSFLWNQLDFYERSELMHSCFSDFYKYHLYHESGASFLLMILQDCSPSYVTPLQYYKLLRSTVDTNNNELFVVLWKRKLAVLSFETVGHLLWTLLLEKDSNFELSTMIINDYGERKVEVLNELDKRIESVNYDFSDRIDGFLSAASIKHLRDDGFPRNPKHRSDRPHRRTLYARRSHRLY